MDSDCFFFTYLDDEQVLRIGPLCVTCRERDPEIAAHFWEGSRRGYKSDALFACNRCGHVIHQPEGEGNPPDPGDTPPTLRPPLKTHGGKHYLSGFVIDHFPGGYERLDYCEPFAGGASVLLNKRRSGREVLGDIDYPTIAVWRAIQGDCDRFVSALKDVPYSRESFEGSLGSDPKSPFDCAVREYTLRRMSRGGLKRDFAWSKRLRGGRPGDQNAWMTMLDVLPAIAARVRGVDLRHEDFRTLLARHARRDALLYLDPPYMQETRAKGCDDVYGHELTRRDHVDLCELCVSSPAQIVLSGYPSPLYAELLSGWNRYSKQVANHASQSRSKQQKTECVWTNF